MKTECSKCQAVMPPPKPPPASESPWPGHAAVFVVTGYKCKACGHFNDLRRRRGFAAWREKQGANLRCTCPSGDGSLRWPCPRHPPSIPK